MKATPWPRGHRAQPTVPRNGIQPGPCVMNSGQPCVLRVKHSSLACKAVEDDSDAELERDDAGEITDAERAKLQQQVQDCRLYEHTIPSPIGSEYGEGFMQFSARASPVHVDVDILNEKLAPKGSLRLRHAMKPDEGYGVIICWDGVVCDTRAMQRRAWAAAALEHDKTIPSLEREQMFTVAPLRVIMDVLHWTRDFREAQAIAYSVATSYADQFRNNTSIESAVPGLEKWLTALDSSNVRYALVSNVDKASLTTALKSMGLEDRFRFIVCAEDGMETTSQRFLSAAIKMGRPPKQCVAFVPDIESIAAAHNSTMRAVALVGVYPGYRLKTADLTCGNMADLKVYNLRRLFSNADSDFMVLLKENTGQKPPRLKPTGSSVMD